MHVVRRLILLILASNLFGATPIFPLKDVRPGQRGIGKTVFTGSRIEEFGVEVLGVLENLGPKQSIILARLSGGPLERTGVIQGMSGSPVYIDGKLAGAVALAFSFAKDPIAGIRPIEDMLALGEPGIDSRRPPRTVAWKGLPSPDWLLPVAAPKLGDMVEIATPLSLSGFTSRTVDQFVDGLRKLGLEPRQGVSSGGKLPPEMGDPASLHPGDMISVQLLSGDWSVSADGTVTTIDGNRLFAFGHRFLSVGATELPFARADVITTMANLSTSFKISSPHEWMGTITEDRGTSIYGELGRRASTVPLEIAVNGARIAPRSYNMQMVNDRILSPFLLQMAVFSAIDATERTLGTGTIGLRGSIDFASGVPPLKIDNTYAADFGAPLSASLGVSSPLALIMSAGFDSLAIKGVRLTIDVSEKKRVYQIGEVAISKKETHPGDTVELAITLEGEDGAELLRNATFRIPIGAPLGPLEFTIADASTANLTEFQALLGVTPRTPQQLVSFLNGLRPNTNAYLRVWRYDAPLQAGGVELPEPPPSVALLLAKSQASPQTVWLGRGSTIGELKIDAGDAVVTGSKTVQVDVKE